MPTRLDTADRKLLTIGAGLLVLLLVAIAALSPPQQLVQSPVPSTHSTGVQGAEAAYLLLEKLHYPVRRWENSPADLPSNATDDLLILADPTETPTRQERLDLANFVRRGGHVLFTGSAIGTYFPNAGTLRISHRPQDESYSANFPSHLDRGVQRMEMRPEAFWSALSDSQLAVYGTDDAPVVISWRVGLGDILWWAGPTPLTNAGITRADNLSFFLDSVSEGAGVLPYQIYWDEYFHGERSSLISYVGKTSLAWAFVQFGLLALALLFTFSRRSGPLWMPTPVSRLSPLEFVDTLGGLYERAGASSAAVGVSRSRLRFLLARRLGLPSDVRDLELADAAVQRLGFHRGALENLLTRAASASHNSTLPSAEALTLVRELEQTASALGTWAHIPKEEN